jgi:hypothetical protein
MKPHLSLLTLLWLVGAGGSVAADGGRTVPIVVAPEAPSAVHSAARDLAAGLARLHPDTAFPLVARGGAARQAIVLGLASSPAVSVLRPGAVPVARESFTVGVHRGASGQATGVIAGADALGTAFAVYALLERLGHGHYLSFDAGAEPAGRPFDFREWELIDRPLALERIVFNWHNFLSGCSAWDFPQWAHWINQARKQRFNTIMVHAYGNNPMFTFRHGGKEKPIGFLTTTAKGRDWGTAHVNDVRRLAGGEAFAGPVFGAEAALAPDDRRATESQALMRRVFAHAAAQGLHVCFALDIDTISSNPQELILTLPEHARFRLADGRTFLPRPDTAEGFAYVRAQAAALFALYPQIDRLTLWVRKGGTTWTTLKVSDLPADWRAAYEARLAAEPALRPLKQGPGRFGLGHLITAWQRALRELGRADLPLSLGSWDVEWMHESDPWTPAGLSFLPLDWEVVHDKSHLATPEGRASIRAIAQRRPVIPIAWAHHDDGHYLGRPYVPPARFVEVLADCGAASFGIIHWTTRPLDLYFRSLAEQTWDASANRDLRATCDEMAARAFGPVARGEGGAYLHDWITTGPLFGRDTSDFFIDRPFPPERVAAEVAGARRRLARLDRVAAAVSSPGGRERLGYFRGLEEFSIAFHEAEGAHQQAAAALKAGDRDAARLLIAPVQPARVIALYARGAERGGFTPGERGLLATMNLKWRTHVEALQQAAGLEPVRISFGPTQHEALAQGAGTLSFHADVHGRLWRVLGERETKTPAFALPADAPLELPSDLADFDAALARTGLTIAQPFTFALKPLPDPKGGPALRVPAGRHRLTLVLIGPSRPEDGTSAGTIAVTARPGPAPARSVEVELHRAPGGPIAVAAHRFTVQLARPGTVEITLQPRAGTLRLAAARLDPVTD